MMLNVFDRYIAREVGVSSLKVLLVFIVIVISTELVHLLRWLAEDKIPADSFFNFFFNSVLEYTITLIPISLFIGVMIAFGRFYRDSEMAAMLSAGVGPIRLNIPVLLIAGPVSLMLLLIQLFVAPLISQQRDDIKVEIYNRAEGSHLTAGQFNYSRDGNSIFFMESTDDEGNMLSVFHNMRDDKENRVDIADSARRLERSDRRLFTVMEDGRQYIGNAGEANFRIIEYEEYGVLLPSGTNHTYSGTRSRSTHQLWTSDTPVLKAELQWRFTVPLAALISALIAVPLSYSKPRSSRYSKIALGLLVYLVYSNMLGVGKTWMIQGGIPFWVGTWWVHLLALVGLLLMWRQGGYFNRYGKKAYGT